MNELERYLNKIKNHEKIFNYNLERYQNKKYDNLYYYTNIRTLENILRNEVLWLSSSKYLNDATEINYTRYLIYYLCDIYLDKKSSFTEKFKQYLDTILNTVDQHLGDIYILSLSKNGDSLSLWPNYSNYDGYNIGFNYENFKKLFCSSSYKFINKNNEIIHVQKNSQFIYDFGEVIYNKKDQINILKERVIFLYNLYKNYYSYNKDSNFELLIINILYDIVYISAFFKDDSFKQEQECRVVIRIIDKNLHGSIIKHRICNGAFIPYIEISLKNLIQDSRTIPLQRITIGPKNNLDIAKIGLISFLKNEGYNDVNIYKSKIPLRY